MERRRRGTMDTIEVKFDDASGTATIVVDYHNLASLFAILIHAEDPSHIALALRLTQDAIKELPDCLTRTMARSVHIWFGSWRKL